MIRVCFRFNADSRQYQTVTICVEIDADTETLADARDRARAAFQQLVRRREGYQRLFGDRYRMVLLPVLGIPVEE